MPAKILILDIETAPSIGYTWGPKWETSIIEFIEPWYMLSMAYKWLGEKQTHVLAICDYPGYKPGDKDKRLTEDIIKVIGKADIVLAHNGDRFDVKKINTRALIHGIPPPKPYKTIDTKKIAKHKFGFDSNSLNDLAKSLGLKPKVQTGGFSLWLGCIGGDMKAWRKMKKYNKRDVDLLEEIYLLMRGWATLHPDVSKYLVEPACKACGSKNFSLRGSRTTLSTRTQAIQCNDCHHWSSIPMRKT